MYVLNLSDIAFTAYLRIMFDIKCNVFLLLIEINDLFNTFFSRLREERGEAERALALDHKVRDLSSHNGT